MGLKCWIRVRRKTNAFAAFEKKTSKTSIFDRTQDPVSIAGSGRIRYTATVLK
jgi:hypothetical protein